MPPKNKAPANLAEARERRWPQQQEQPEEDAEPVAAAGAAPPPPPAEAGLPPHPAMARKRLRDRPQQQHDGEQRQWGGMAGAVLGAVATALTSPFKAAAAAAAAVLSPSRPPRPVRRRLADDGTRSEQQPAVGSDGELRAGMEVESGQLSGSSTEAEDEGPRRVLVGSPPAPPVQQQAAAREEPPPAPQQQQAQQRRQQEQQEQQGRQGQQEQEHAQEHAQEQPPGGGWVLRSRGVAATRQEDLDQQQRMLLQFTEGWDKVTPSAPAGGDDDGGQRGGMPGRRDRELQFGHIHTTSSPPSAVPAAMASQDQAQGAQKRKQTHPSRHQAVLDAAPVGAVAALAGRLGVPPYGLAQLFQPAELAVALDQVQGAARTASAEANGAEAVEVEEQQQHAPGPLPQRQHQQLEAQQAQQQQPQQAQQQQRGAPAAPPPLHQQPAPAPAGQPQQQDLFTQLLDAASAPTAAAAGLTPELVCEFVALLPRLLPAEQADKDRQLRLLLQRGLLGPAARLMAAAWGLHHLAHTPGAAGGTP
ncbi:hypothetical protein C2E20_6277 [Micractinium conductrix]|uniref:Uncharacterized protein n=1 Tax=Micractinium conductrix TaxID=554055 RepID=A0A2P6V7R6_9CHLO|nr:hypothetical protein C2E20_6277 [Micractinium conductrix]|eukprot:PSC70137.1 hypothetical protein C2E20_6277 [Micractinium conductrix]